MDSLTQAVLGATVQTALLGRWQGRRAIFYGAALGTLPDLDVVIDYGNAVKEMTYHRGFSHSLFVLTGLALLLTAICGRWRAPGYSQGRLFLTLWLVLVTHPLLDAFTTYGTQLFWPLPSTPVAWSSVFIIDPLYTLPLLVAVLAGLLMGPHGRSPRLAVAALALSTAYLGWTLVAKYSAERQVRQVLAAQGQADARLFSAPLPFTSLLWRVMVDDGPERYRETWVGLFDDRPPALVPLPRGGELAPILADSPAEQRLRWFTDDWLRYDRLGNDLVVTDLRLGATGYHSFRFVLAQREASGWRLVAEPSLWPRERGGREQLAVVWRRLWHPELPSPVADWAARLSRMPD